MKRCCFISLIVSLLSCLSPWLSPLHAQDVDYWQSFIEELADDKYRGRGEYRNGGKMAADFVFDRMSELNDMSVSRQAFSLDINVFHDKVSLKVDRQKLRPGYDYIFREFSPSCEGKFALRYLLPEEHDPEVLLPLLRSGNLKDIFVVMDFDSIYRYMGIAPEVLYHTPIAGIVMVHEKASVPTFFKSRCSTVQPLPVVWASRNFPKDGKQVNINLQARMLYDYPKENIIGLLPGTSGSDSTLIFVAHYDHLGHFGRSVQYNGANDNASGVAMMFDLARYYSQKENRKPYNMIFMAAGAEENNLRGSEYYVAHPTVDLQKVKCVLNLDMVADDSRTLLVETGDVGEKGQRAVDLLQKVNDTLHSFDRIRQNPLSNDSDHYPFAVRGIPAIYFSSEGSMYAYYHTPLDLPSHTAVSQYASWFRLLTAFVDALH